MISNKNRDLMSLSQASKYLGCHQNTLRNWNEAGLIKSVRIGIRGDRKFLKNDLDKFISKNMYNGDNSTLLPSDYDISRIDMTSTKYEGNVSDVELAHKDEFGVNLLNRETIDEFDFIAFKEQFVNGIKFFKEKDFVKCNSTAEMVLRIITSPRYRSGSLYVLELDKYKQSILKKIQYFIDNDLPIDFMLPALPFKVANPLKSTRGDADLAEVGAFLRFNEIHLQIKKIYKNGAKFTIFHDGHLYYKHFLHKKSDADRYFNTMKKFVKNLKLTDVITILDVNDELKKIPNFMDIYEKSRKRMTALWDKDKYNNEKIRSIINSAKHNIKTKDIPYEVLYKIEFFEDGSLNKEEKEAKKEINLTAESCAFEYMVVQDSLEKAKFFTTILPHGIRLTVHPKSGQIGIFLNKAKTFLLPWMGVGVLKKDGQITVRYESTVKNNSKYHPVFIKGERHPFYYKEVETVYSGIDGLNRMFDGIIETLDKDDFYWSFAFGTEYLDKSVRDMLSGVHKSLEKNNVEDIAICSSDSYDKIRKTYESNKNIVIVPIDGEHPNGVIILRDRVINLVWGEDPVAHETRNVEVVKHYHRYFKKMLSSVNYKHN